MITLTNDRPKLSYVGFVIALAALGIATACSWSSVSMAFAVALGIGAVICREMAKGENLIFVPALAFSAMLATGISLILNDVPLWLACGAMLLAVLCVFGLMYLRQAPSSSA